MNNLIGISGRMGAGKDTLGMAIMYESFKMLAPDSNITFNDYVEEYEYNGAGWQIKKFAGKLKYISSILTGIPSWKFEDPDFKKTNLGEEWDEVKFNNRFPMTVRQFLQRVGTEAMRDSVHKNIWINALFADFTPNSTWIITDCRFKNEFDSIRKRGGLIIFIERGDNNTGTHPSEVEMEIFKDSCDYHIDNNGTFEKLQEQARNFLNIHNIITPDIREAQSY